MSQLLIELPTVLTGAVSFIVDNQQEEVFLRLLARIKQSEGIVDYRNVNRFIDIWHDNHKRHPYMFSNGCGCEYCIKTREYANLKLNIHRLKWRLDENFSIYPSERYKADVQYLAQLETKLRDILTERKTMRSHLGFISKRTLKPM
jgi:hypothetical protein